MPLKLVVDTSIFVSMLLSKRAEAWKIFELKHEYHTLDLTFIEIKRHFLMIWMRSRLTRQEFAETLLTIPTMVKIFPLNEIPSATLREAHDIIGLRDPGDTPFVALMLHINASGIVSYNKDFQVIEQRGYKHYKPRELLQ